MEVKENGKKAGFGARWGAAANAAKDGNVGRSDNGEANEERAAALNDEKKSRATRIWEAKKGEAENVLADSAKARSVFSNLKKWLERFGKPRLFATRTSAAFDGVKTLFRALEATFSGEYRGFSKKTLVALTAAALYCVSPLDAIFDGIPGLGFCDDIFVVSVALRAVAAELRTFRRWERIKAARELFRGVRERLTAIERVVLCPGWMAAEAPVDEIVETLRPAFPRATFDRYRWPSNGPWNEARDYVDGNGVDAFAQFAATLPTEPTKIALIGHSLGARSTVRALARRTRRGETPFGAAFLLGAAVDADEPELETATRGVLAPLGNFFAEADRVLKYAYQTAEGKTPLGLRGSEQKWENYVDCKVSGDEEFWLEMGENAVSAATLLTSKGLFGKLALSADVAAKAKEASRHCFAQYATFFRSVFERE